MDDVNMNGKLQFRILIAACLLAVAIIFDRNGIKVAGITTDKIAMVISADYYEDIFLDWMKASDDYNNPHK